VPFNDGKTPLGPFLAVLVVYGVMVMTKSWQKLGKMRIVVNIFEEKRKPLNPNAGMAGKDSGAVTSMDRTLEIWGAHKGGFHTRWIRLLRRR